MSGRAGALLIAVLVLCLRLPFLNQAIQGDDVYYLYAAEYAQIDPLHPNHAKFVLDGVPVDMRGHPHGPLNGWILAAPLAVLGDVREIPFHFRYILFSLIAALSVWSLARRFSPQPLLATVIFLAIPAFVVNGNSLEADVPFLAFFLASVAFFVTGRPILLALSALCGALAGLTAYQAVVLTPLLAHYVWHNGNRKSKSAWLATLAAPVTILAFQLYERLSSGALPAAVLAGYMQSYGLQTLINKIRNAVALIVHTAWIAGPLIAVLAFYKTSKWIWALAAGAGLAGAFYDPNPLFWASLAIGVLVLAWCALHIFEDFLAAWVVLFFFVAVAIFFAGSARYLLPIGAPIAILASQRVGKRWLIAGIVLQLPLSLALASVNYLHWDGYRQFAATMAKEAADRRVWINGEWGLRYYLESEGALPIERAQPPRAGDLVVSSELSHIQIPGNLPAVKLRETTLTSSLPLRIFALDSPSAYSTAAHGLRPFDISTGPLDRVRVEAITERKPVFEYLEVKSPEARRQIVGGIHDDGWTEQIAEVVLKAPAAPLPLRAVFYIPPQAPARTVTLSLNGAEVASQTYARDGLYTLTSPPQSMATPEASVTLAVDKTFSLPPDKRVLGVVLSGIGFHE